MAFDRNTLLTDGERSMTGGRQDCMIMSSGLSSALALIGDRWTLQIVAQLVESPRRFGELAKQLPGISPNILTDRLRHLERNGMVATVPYSRRPIRLAYGLTDSGRDLHGAIGLLAAWGARRTGTAEGPVHDACGTPLETRLFCPTCTIPVDEVHDEVLRWL